MSAPAPLVAVFGQLRLPGQDEEIGRALHRFADTAAAAVREAGGRPVLVDVAADPEPDGALLREAGALVVLGGGDIEPARYGGREPVPNGFGVDPRSDERQLGVLAEALARDLPVLAICRGTQLLNVACGGDLIPDLDPGGLHRGGPGRSMFLDEEVRLEPDSRLGRVFAGRTRLVVRSGHHQAAGRLGEGLRASARAADGVVEGLEHAHRSWTVGVQWHPEDPDGSAADRRALFRALLAQSRRER